MAGSMGKQLGRAAVAGAGGYSSLAMKGLTKGMASATEIGQPIEGENLLHQLPGEITATDAQPLPGRFIVFFLFHPAAKLLD